MLVGSTENSSEAPVSAKGWQRGMQVNRGGGTMESAFRRRRAVGIRFGAHIDHAGVAGGIEMGE